MPAINFQARFVPMIESGEKRQTIRARNRFKVGDTLFLYTGMRQKGCRKIGYAECVRVTKVEIHEGGMSMFKNGKLVDLTVDERMAMAQQDGFDWYSSMAKWFEDTHGPLPFHGFLIRWENFRKAAEKCPS